MAQLRLVEPTIDTYGSRRAWKRRRRERQRGVPQRGPSLAAVTVGSLVLLVLVVVVVLLLSQVASAFVG
jgi:Flp pilus assembly protein TadB